MFRFRKSTPPEKTVQPMPSGTPARKAIQVKVMRPERFADAPLIADELLSGRTVVIQPERMEREALRHLLDFISGVTYAVDGSMKRLGNGNTFLVTPEGVSPAEAEAEAEEAVRSSAPAEAPAPPPPPPAVTDPVAAMFSSVGDDD